MFKLAEKCCDQCLFGPNKIVGDNRKAAVLAGCAHEDRHFVCHKATMVGEDVCCRGFYEAMPGVGQMRVIAERLDAIEEVDVMAPPYTTEPKEETA